MSQHAAISPEETADRLVTTRSGLIGLISNGSTTRSTATDAAR